MDVIPPGDADEQIGLTLGGMAGRLRESLHAVHRLFAETTRGDLLIGVGFTLAGALGFAGTFMSHPARFVGPVPILIALFSITLRRQRPVLPLAAITATAGAAAIAARLMPGSDQGGDGSAPVLFGLLFATFSLGMHGNRRELAIGGPLPLLMIAVIDGLDPVRYPVAGGLAFTAVFLVGAPLLVGRLLRDRSRLVAELRQQEALLRAEKGASAEAALAGEKLELAVQLQAILETGMERLVAHVNLAQVADQEHRQSAVGGIEAVARELLGELRIVLASISPGDDVSQWTGVGLRAALDRARVLAPDADPAGPAVEQLNVTRELAQLQSKLRRALDRWDLWLAAAVFVGLAFDVQTNSRAGLAPAVTVLGCFAVAAPLSLASRRPLLAVAASTAVTTIFSISVRPLTVTNLLTSISLFFALPFVVGTFEHRRRAVAGLTICLLGTLATQGLDSIAGIAPLLIGAWFAGRVFRDRSRLAAALRETNRRLALERQENNRRIVLEERARMTREVHDVVGHSLTVIALQAGAARRLWNRDREKAEGALVTIARVAEEGRRDLSRGGDMNGNLEALDAEPPRLLEIHDLVERAQLAGLTVGVQVRGSEVRLNPAAELAAYRLVQEALTNVLKHVPVATAEISLRYREAGLEVAVNNAIKVLPASDPALGRGLSGMLERVTACGGTLEWGPNPAGEFEVRAWFPAAAGDR
jgi:signal transduction histidine kinase